jgi:prepilin-type N-terminal cleavage/methylation domain-containing protein
VKSAPRGFTLLELLITLSVTTIGLIGLLSLHLSIARGNDGASRSAEAQQIGATELETLRSLNSGALMVALGAASTASPPVIAPVKIVAGRPGMTYRVIRSVVALPGTTSLWRIRVETAWTDDGAAQGANGGQLDHMLPLEVVRTLEEAL